MFRRLAFDQPGHRECAAQSHSSGQHDGGRQCHNDVHFQAARGTDSTNQRSRKRRDRRAPGWRIIDNFEFLNPGHIGGQGGWQNA